MNTAMMIRRVLLAMTLLVAITAFGGCRTAHGFGEDMERTGEKIQEKTDK
jgi:predicted small secreted protein